MNINDEAEITVFSGQSQKIEILMQQEVQLDINVPLFYIKSGEEEIQAYVNNHAKPQLDDFTKQKQQEISKTAEETIKTVEDAAGAFVEEEIKPSIAEYANSVVKPLSETAAESAATAVSSKEAAETAAGNAAQSAEQAQNALEQATGEINEAKTAAIEEFNTNATEKLTVFNTNAAEKQDAVDASAAAAAESADRAEQAAEKAEASTQGGFYNRVHDCILENPNRIYYKIDGSTLTFKAGTKIWYPDGRSVVLENDISGTRTKTSNIVWIDLVNNALIFDDQNIHGPFLDSSYFYSGTYYYSSTENKFQYCETDDVLTGDYPVPLPVIYAKGDISLGIDISNGIICNYYNWFNAVTVFVPAGIKVLFAKGLKEDGSFNNTQYITEAIFNYKGKNTFNYVALKEDGTIIWSGRGFSITDDNFLKNLDTGEIFSGIRLGGAYNDSPSTGYINGVLDLQNPTKLVYWDA